MGRKKCMTCHECITDIEISAVIGKKDMHFCSEKCKDVAVKEQKEKEKRAADKDRTYRLVCDILGVQEIINTALWREWQTWNKVADDAKIGDYLAENKYELTKLISRLDSAIYPRIRYLSAVIKNKITDYKPKVETNNEPKESTFAIFEPVAVTKQSRRSFADLEDDI